MARWLLLLLLLLPTAAAHGTHGIIHVVTLHWMPWLGALFADAHCKGCYFLVFVPTIREIRDFYREMQRTNRESAIL
eukprot:SAG31_NODE_4326_length_3354_cov_11.627035_2_plen_77_part_00